MERRASGEGKERPLGREAAEERLGRRGQKVGARAVG